MSSISHIYVDTQSLLEECVLELLNEKIIAFDTEFLREETYYPILQLIQLATQNKVYIIDPLAENIHDLKVLNSVFTNENIIKVIHSGRQDIEIFWHDLQCLPKPIFDTQIAAIALGFGDQIGYLQLIKSVFDIDIDKSQQRTNWAKRPLDEKQINYAATDVFHLIPLYNHINQQLTDLNRHEWLKDFYEPLYKVETYEPDFENGWKKTKPKQKTAKSYALYKSLYNWRERTAQSQNLRRGRICNDDVLYELVNKTPKTQEQLNTIRSLSKILIKNHSEEILNAIQEGFDLAKNAYFLNIIQTPQKPIPTIHQQLQIDALKLLQKIITHEQKIIPSLLCDNDELYDFILNQTPNHILLSSTWRYEIFGKIAQDFLQGNVKISINAGHLIIE
jgi:ribonuclease D